MYWIAVKSMDLCTIKRYRQIYFHLLSACRKGRCRRHRLVWAREWVTDMSRQDYFWTARQCSVDFRIDHSICCFLLVFFVGVWKLNDAMSVLKPSRHLLLRVWWVTFKSQRRNFTPLIKSVMNFISVDVYKRQIYKNIRAHCFERIIAVFVKVITAQYYVPYNKWSMLPMW